MTETQLLIFTPFILVAVAGLFKSLRWLYKDDFEKNRLKIKEIISWTPLALLLTLSFVDMYFGSEYWIYLVVIFFPYLLFLRYKSLKVDLLNERDIKQRLNKLEAQVEQLKTVTLNEK